MGIARNCVFESICRFVSEAQYSSERHAVPGIVAGRI